MRLPATLATATATAHCHPHNHITPHLSNAQHTQHTQAKATRPLRSHPGLPGTSYFSRASPSLLSRIIATFSASPRVKPISANSSRSHSTRLASRLASRLATPLPGQGCDSGWGGFPRFPGPFPLRLMALGGGRGRPRGEEARWVKGRGGRGQGLGGVERVWLGASNAGSSSFLRRILCVPATPARVLQNRT